MKFRRKAADDIEEPVDERLDESVDAADETPRDASDDVVDDSSGNSSGNSSGHSSGGAGSQGPGAGPYDAEDLDDTDGRVDLGSLVVLPVPGTELQLQVDEASGNVQSVMFAGPEGALELRVFAAPRNGDLWSEVRPQIAADLARRGGTATERDGPFGTELVCQMPVTRPDGKSGLQPSRVVGINGTRWMLRATFLGRPATDPEAGAELEQALTTVAVRRGEHAMPVGDPLALTMPTDARRTGG